MKVSRARLFTIFNVRAIFVIALIGLASSAPLGNADDLDYNSLVDMGKTHLNFDSYRGIREIMNSTELPTQEPNISPKYQSNVDNFFVFHEEKTKGDKKTFSV